MPSYLHPICLQIIYGPYFIYNWGGGGDDLQLKLQVAKSSLCTLY